MSQREKSSAASDRGFVRIPDVVLLVLELLVLLVVLAIAWKERSAMPRVPISDPDTWGYLNPALSWLSGLGLQQTDGRDWLYPALLALFLKTTGSFTGIVLWQKLLAISSGLLMAVAWRCWVSTLPFNRWILFFLSLSGALPIFIQLMNQQNILFEMSIRPEALLSFFVYAQLACLMGYYICRWKTPKAHGNRRPESGFEALREVPGAVRTIRKENYEPTQALLSIVLGAAAIVLSYACFLLKPSWLLAFVVTSAPVFVGLFGRTLPFRTRVLAPALGIVFSLLILWLPSAVFLIKDSASFTLLPDALFAVHVKLIDKTLDARLASLPDSDPEKARLQALVTVLKSELQVAEASHTYEKLGFNADYLMHSATFTNAIRRYTGNDDRKFRAFCISCYRDAALHDPLAFGWKISVQFTHFLFPRPETFFKDHIDLAGSYQDSVADLNPNLADRLRPDVKQMYHQYLADLIVQAGSGLRLERESKFRAFRRAFTPLALPLEILFLLTFAASLIWPPLRDLRLGGWAAFSLFSAPLGNAVTVCVVHALDIARYRLTYGGFLLLALVAMALYSILVIARSLRHAIGAFSKGSERS
jgi:hypothetical protein